MRVRAMIGHGARPEAHTGDIRRVHRGTADSGAWPGLDHFTEAQCDELLEELLRDGPEGRHDGAFTLWRIGNAGTARSAPAATYDALPLTKDVRRPVAPGSRHDGPGA